ncbi:MAG: hypothetical protein U9N04_03935 [Patescibacteria group bacterium]|nr:hypothetical protein [Patescibacteria group bacterium]
MLIKEKTKDIILVLAIILIGFLFLSYFKIKHQMTFTNLDELLWMYRSRFFMDGILSGDFSNLIQSSQPGIMAMWLIGPFMKIVSYDFMSISNFIADLNNSGIPYNIINGNDQQIYADYKELSFLLNIPIFGVIIFFTFSLYYLLKKLSFSKWAIFFSLLLIVTTPYYIYFTTPTDKLVGIFSTLSILSLLVYAGNKGGKKFLFASAILCSWAVLTKISALFLVPFSLLVLAFYKLNYCFLKSLKPQASSLKNIIKDCFFWLITFLTTSIIFLPTIITDPRSILNFFTKESSKRIITESPVSYDPFLNFKIILAYLSDSFLLSFNLFVMAVFIAFICLLIQKTKRKIEIDKRVVILIIYCLSFFLFVTLFSKTYSFRYLVPALIIFQIAAGIGIYEFSSIIAEKNKTINKNITYLFTVIFILLSQALLIYYSAIEKIEELPYFG